MTDAPGRTGSGHATRFKTLAGGVSVRRLLGIGWAWPRMAGAVAALATIPVGVFAAVEAQLAVVTLLLVMLLILERRLLLVGSRRSI